MEKLSDKQQRFTVAVARLILWAHAHGYGLTFAEAYRTPEMAEAYAKAGKGIANSLHSIRLAIDLNLFKGGVYLRESADHKPLGEYWKTLDPLARWGGDFKKPDGNHYSFEHDGVQ